MANALDGFAVAGHPADEGGRGAAAAVYALGEDLKDLSAADEFAGGLVLKELSTQASGNAVNIGFGDADGHLRDTPDKVGAKDRDVDENDVPPQRRGDGVGESVHGVS